MINQIKLGVVYAIRKDLNLMIWLTQLGLSVAAPLAGFIILGVWLHSSLGWGIWTVWCGVVLGISGAVSGLRSSLKIMEQMSASKKPADPPPVAFNDHT